MIKIIEINIASAKPSCSMKPIIPLIKAAIIKIIIRTSLNWLINISKIVSFSSSIKALGPWIDLCWLTCELFRPLMFDPNLLRASDSDIE